MTKKTLKKEFNREILIENIINKLRKLNYQSMTEAKLLFASKVILSDLVASFQVLHSFKRHDFIDVTKILHKLNKRSVEFSTLFVQEKKERDGFKMLETHLNSLLKASQEQVLLLQAQVEEQTRNKIRIQKII